MAGAPLCPNVLLEAPVHALSLEAFGQRIRTLRMEKNLSQQQLAELIYVSRKTVGNWEAGNRLPDITMVSRLAVCLGVEICGSCVKSCRGGAVRLPQGGRRTAFCEGKTGFGRFPERGHGGGLSPGGGASCLPLLYQPDLYRCQRRTRGGGDAHPCLRLYTQTPLRRGHPQRSSRASPPRPGACVSQRKNARTIQLDGSGVFALYYTLAAPFATISPMGTPL